MTKRKSFEEVMESRLNGRIKRADRTMARDERRHREALAAVGTLVRDGKPVYYVFPVGGKYREAASPFELI